jgi:hypothetical protein
MSLLVNINACNLDCLCCAFLCIHTNHLAIIACLFYRFIEFEDEMAATTAVISMNNFELGGLILHVGKAVIGGPLSEGMRALEKLPPLPAGAQLPQTPTTTPSKSAAGGDICMTCEGYLMV